MTRLTRLTWAFAASALLMLALSGPGTRLGLWPWQGGLILFALAGLLGTVAALAAAFGKRLGALALAVAAASVPLFALVQAVLAPRMNDVSRQLLIPGAPESVFPKAMAAVEAMNWESVKGDSKAGRIEAVATTFWFGFRDDVQVRVTPAGSGSQVEIRSKSRVGRGDSGTNARRIEAYFERLR